MGLWEILGRFRIEFGKEPSYIAINDYTYYNNHDFIKFRADNEKAFKDSSFCEIPFVMSIDFNDLPNNHVGLYIVPGGYRLVKEDKPIRSTERLDKLESGSR